MTLGLAFGILKYHGGKIGYDLRNLVVNYTTYHCSCWVVYCLCTFSSSACRKEWNDLRDQVWSHGEEAGYLS